MEIITVKNRENWPKQGSFAQEWEWGEVLRAEGVEVERLLVKDGAVTFKAQVFYKTLPLGWKYAWCPKGPVFVILSETKDPLKFDYQGIFSPLRLPRLTRVKAGEDKLGQKRVSQNDSKKMYKELVDYLKIKKCVFVRCEPEDLSSGVRLSQVKDVNPKTTLILDLSKSLEEISAGMKKNTRYSIRFAEKQNLTIKENKDLEVFWRLMQKTAVRDQFSAHGKKHYESVLTHPGVYQLTAYLGDMPVASAIFLGSGDTFTYLFAASDYVYHKLLAPYLLQWEAIKIAKQLGYKKYDFFGIASEDKKSPPKADQPRAEKIKNQNSEEKYLYDIKHHYAGITKFKLGFGGIPKIFPGTFDIILDVKKYWIYKILHFIYGIRKIGR